MMAILIALQWVEKVLWFFISLGKFKVIPFKSSARYLVWIASGKHKIKSYGMSGEMYVGPRTCWDYR